MRKLILGATLLLLSTSIGHAESVGNKAFAKDLENPGNMIVTLTWQEPYRTAGLRVDSAMTRVYSAPIDAIVSERSKNKLNAGSYQTTLAKEVTKLDKEETDMNDEINRV